ncbi:RrF2 family transcriptional regulator [Zeimonas arvi]|uniref:Rrf2 family transcriptional regulator n=1 Tax=Zeimonas arvi TaxID=2498847 RepID=A0A5C8NQD1_9BURK|nr:Rrf2 family transcriptional regulator [Zeimonas arvi]TXL63522.1 Rrf2 family transcriptional regulator [Zeimonas arvi]
MRLAEYTDFTLRVLMYCAVNADRLVTVGELAEQHGVSKNHLMKIVSDLANQGILETIRGRGGGLRLSRAPDEIRVGGIVRRSETDFRLVECFDGRTNTCTLTPTCRLRHLFEGALAAYFRELDGATLADIAPLPPEPRGTPRRAASGPILAKIAPPVSRKRAPPKRSG